MSSLEQVDAELTAWRERLGAASRNVSELTELPEYAAAAQAAKGAGRLAEASARLVATVDELWQGVLLIGAALDRAEAARRTGSRLWRGEEAAQQALDLLHGPSIHVDLADTPVLHRRLLAGPRAQATVSADTLLQTMDAAFDRARESLEQIAGASQRAAALRTRLGGMVARLQYPGVWPDRLAAVSGDALDQCDALEVLRPELEAALSREQRAQSAMAAARQALATLSTTLTEAAPVVEHCRATVLVTLPALDAAAMADLTAWLDRLGQTLAAGRWEAGLAGLASWQHLHERLATEVSALISAAQAALARRDELQARFGALRAKQRALGTPDPTLESVAVTAKASVTDLPLDIDAATTALTAYTAALATRHGALR